MPSFQTTLDELVSEAGESFLTKRKNPSGHISPIETSFDNALIILKLFELTNNSEYLKRWQNRISKNALNQKGALKWNFSPLVKDIPADTDSTAMNLLVLTMAKRFDVPVKLTFDVSANALQFERLKDFSGGIKTYFGKKLNNDIDPVVNTAIAFFYELNRLESNLQKYFASQLSNLNKPRISAYYIKATYFAERMAKLLFYKPDISDQESAKQLDEYLLNAKPRNALELALLSIGAAYRGLNDRAVSLNQTLKLKMNKNGFWNFGTLYRQRTPRFNYGNERLTTLFALEALKLEETDFYLKKISY